LEFTTVKVAEFEADDVITVIPTEANLGGLLVDMHGIKGFVPLSQLAPIHYPRVEQGDSKKIVWELQKLIGETMEVKILDLDLKHKKLIFSEKAKEKIKKFGNETLTILEEIKKNPEGKGINILDSSPGTSCPVVETVKDVDLCILVTDPTPFGINDLKLSVDMAREVGQEPVIVVNRAEYKDTALKEYCLEEQLDIIGEIPDERRIAESYSRGEFSRGGIS